MNAARKNMRRTRRTTRDFICVADAAFPVLVYNNISYEISAVVPGTDDPNSRADGQRVGFEIRNFPYLHKISTTLKLGQVVAASGGVILK